jgi:DNA-binding transcriptional ArsR family regulator
MSALATSSRVRILGRLREGPCTVGELALAVEMEQPAVSHQLRILRDLGLVLGSRTGRHVIYGLYDSHVAALLDEALRHIEHLRVGAPEAPLATASDPTTISEGAHMTDEHTHDAPHAHEHEHDGETHAHAHTAHDHEHVEHAHDHEHDGEKHEHTHVHEAGLEDVHEHDHA